MSSKKINIDSGIVIRLFNEGNGIKKISKMLNVSRTVIRRVYDENNLTRKPTSSNSIDIFWARVNKLGDGLCWNWLGSVNNKGYGQFRMSGKLYITHRLSYILINGEIPIGLHLCHRCDNPLCCNPDHLFLGTRSDNMVDCILKSRRPNVKLNVDKVREIRKLKYWSNSYKAIADQFAISHSTVHEIVRGDKWKHVI